MNTLIKLAEKVFECMFSSLESETGGLSKWR
jgi:hypothetical protein